MTFHCAFRAVVSDLDGTLLNAQHYVGDFTIETLQRLEQHGVDIVLATGRSQPDVAGIIKRIGLKRGVMITSNGARIHDISGNSLYAQFLPEAIAQQLVQVPFDRHNVVMNAYQNGQWYISQAVPEFERFFKDSGYSYTVVDFASHPLTDCEKVFFIARESAFLEPIEHTVRAQLGDEVSITHSGPRCVEFMQKGVSKAAALTALLAHRDYDLSACVAFGDGLNDLAMLQEVGKGCVMGNADPRLKAQAKGLLHIGTNSNESVASFLRAHFGV
ncbi:Cof-type HAD-IIB family hydrolase [Pasteurellaceae bacterium HPA106]|uniref:Cof-type HAD-IIB family hydrolase n=1 Tax=Spirabiliibacterium pneumoniae TaxID=221400 RepID=UPI001AAD68DB|nr:Cof-type HAD-IIB family hydrolase [Spirabiliibacterium pneumoniae]MBE2896074.1 Cof-type HAD-IIB family hydrolase [Spirabiliibacterium pneumoniae]